MVWLIKFIHIFIQQTASLGCARHCARNKIKNTVPASKSQAGQRDRHINGNLENNVAQTNNREVRKVIER